MIIFTNCQIVNPLETTLKTVNTDTKNSIGLLASFEVFSDNNYLQYIEELLKGFASITIRVFCLNKNDYQEAIKIWQNNEQISITIVQHIADIYKQIDVFIRQEEKSSEKVINDINSFIFLQCSHIHILPYSAKYKKLLVKDFDNENRPEFLYLFKNIDQVVFNTTILAENNYNFVKTNYIQAISKCNIDSQFIISEYSYYELVYFKSIEFAIQCNAFKRHMFLLRTTMRRIWVQYEDVGNR